MTTKQENTGAILALSSAALWGIFPVVVNRGTQSISPLLFAAITTLLAACGALVYAVATGKLYELKNKKSYVSLVMVTLCIVVIPYILFFIGSSKTSGINSSLLLLSEVIFTLLFTPLIGEKTTVAKLVGAFGVLIGAAFILYNGTVHVNIGDMLIIVSTATYPIGNFYAKKALRVVSPAIILLVRFFLGGCIILAVALAVGPASNITSVIAEQWKLIVLTGFLLLGLSKVLWYEGLKRLDISKAISLVMTFPLFSLIVLIAFFDEVPSIFQWVGIAIMAVGVYCSIRRPSTDPALTKYAS